MWLKAWPGQQLACPHVCRTSRNLFSSKHPFLMWHIGPMHFSCLPKASFSNTASAGLWRNVSSCSQFLIRTINEDPYSRRLLESNLLPYILCIRNPISNSTFAALHSYQWEANSSTHYNSCKVLRLKIFETGRQMQHQTALQGIFGSLISKWPFRQALQEIVDSWPQLQLFAPCEL